MLKGSPKPRAKMLKHHNKFNPYYVSTQRKLINQSTADWQLFNQYSEYKHHDIKVLKIVIVGEVKITENSWRTILSTI